MYNMLCDYIYIVDWEMVESGKVREKTFLDKKEFDEFIKVILESKRYKLLEAYKLDLEEERLQG